MDYVSEEELKIAFQTFDKGQGRVRGFLCCVHPPRGAKSPLGRERLALFLSRVHTRTPN